MTQTGKRLIQALAAGLTGLLVAGLWFGLRPAADPGLIFDQRGSHCAIIVPAPATTEEFAAARLLSETLAAAAGVDARQFPVQKESSWRFWQHGIYVGETTRAGRVPLDIRNRLEHPAGYDVSPAGVVLRGAEITAAAGWFLEKHLGAHWFIPGPLGISVPRRDALRLAAGSQAVMPTFVSRALGGLNAPAEAAWFAANRLQAVIAHGHSMSNIFLPADVARQPELAPLLNWQKYFPTRPNEQEWQPNIAAAAAAPLAAGMLRRELTATPGAVAVRLAMNDSIRYDQSPETLAQAGPPKYFRLKPDYSKLVFGFANKVARELQADFPDRLVSTYAYDWTENTPGFRVEPNVVPYLTADRSQWFDPAFAAQDQELMKRWVAAGPKVVGIYDYYEGAPFLVPRPTLYAVTQSIPFAYAAGVRAYYAEAFPNWGLDGPKYWLAAELLWNANQDPAVLLDTYYREYWQEAAGPMREFFELCDRQWLEQPLPSYWLKYFKDEHQALRFPPEVRRELDRKLEAAHRLARQDIVHSRLALTRAAFAVTDAFCEFNEARDRLSRLALEAKPDAEVLVATAQTMQAARAKLELVLHHTETTQPLALAATLIEEYTRNDPRRRALWRLREAAAPVDQTSAGFVRAFAGLWPGKVPATAVGKELAVDGQLSRLTVRDVADFTALDWVKAGYWRGHGEPYETRRIAVVAGPERNAIRFQGCKQETLSQWHNAQPGADYIGTVKVRARVSPGNMTFLIITFLDEKGKYIGLGSIDRLPVGEWNEAVELAVLVQAPKDAKQIGIGVRVLNQVNDDYAEFAQLSLKQME